MQLAEDRRSKRPCAPRNPDLRCRRPHPRAAGEAPRGRPDQDLLEAVGSARGHRARDDAGADRRAARPPSVGPAGQGPCPPEDRAARGALRGFFTDHHATILRMMLDNVDRISAPDGGLKRLGRIRGRSVDLQDDAGNAFHQAFDIAAGLALRPARPGSAASARPRCRSLTSGGRADPPAAADVSGLEFALRCDDIPLLPITVARPAGGPRVVPAASMVSSSCAAETLLLGL